ncbi:hypothetical protein [Janthinobacterium lividum]|uniref:hypothetical protein n=1 Tax=Janthinobacterium lividum TaxID=29581 RepID=UPI00140E20D5|nr:hypothetical protein [Janthinobacterium lividum]NHQ92201.1 hypothetical protein [Janthinobacterium lividum]
MRADDGAYVRSEVRLPGGSWQPFASASDVGAGRDKVERVFLIEPDGELDGVVRVGCSLQGGVDTSLLREARPDIDASEYPPPPNAADAFDSAPLPSQVLAAAQAALAAAPVWQPRFKTLHFSRESSTPGKPEEKSVLEQEWRVRDGLVSLSEDYNVFTMLRVKIAGNCFSCGPQRRAMSATVIWPPPACRCRCRCRRVYPQAPAFRPI